MREVRASEICAAQNVLVRVGFGISQPTVEVRDPGHWNPVPQVGVHRRLVYWRRPPGECRLKEAVEVGGDDLRVTLRVRRYAGHAVMFSSVSGVIFRQLLPDDSRYPFAPVLPIQQLEQVV